MQKNGVKILIAVAVLLICIAIFISAKHYVTKLNKLSSLILAVKMK
ncbi:MAG: hypothetical protein IKL82_04340 [Clostridia bacterium]|nr:hypothetical protein [Clostridia bacterium]